MINKSIFSFLVAASLTFTFACTPKSGNLVKTPMEPVLPTEPDDLDGLTKTEAEVIELPDLVIEPGPVVNQDTLPLYHPTATHLIDVKHITLRLKFDWEKKHALGVAKLDIKPWFYPVDKVELDAKNFDIHSVKMNNQTAKYSYENDKLTVFLGKTYSRAEQFSITVDYTAKPDERQAIGGSAAISEDKGLYFINADGKDMGKPKQIWTQGETESNSRWFPVVDKPNERCTQEMFLTVRDEYETLSNGVMVDSKKNADGTRTDHYKMDKPHAPYLFMLTVGDFAVVKDKWRNIELEYFVEKKYEKDARAIFRHTDDMLTLFSDKLGYEYPWSKYSQIIVRDYVSGAMENTTGVIFGDFVQMTERELLDHHYDNEKIIAHEMFHHWFGDLVTCESWSNLTLNEGFANYSEYLWLEHKYGRDVADYHLVKEHDGYVSSTGGLGHPLIDFDYNDKEEMFDAISYNKGGAVLHMLRKHVGDEAFWAGLKRYLTDNQYTAVETDELRMAFEDVTGQDLNWFFNQWYFNGGMPKLDITYQWDEVKKEMKMLVVQTQEGNEVSHVFDLPLYVDIYGKDGKTRREAIRVSQREQTFVFPCAAKPDFVNFDAEKALLCEKNDNHTQDEWMYILKKGPVFLDRWEAINALFDVMGEYPGIQMALLSDPAYPIRELAAGAVDVTNPKTQEMLIQSAKNDPSPEVQSAAISTLAEAGVEGMESYYEQNISSQKAYSIIGASLNALSKTNPAKAVAVASVLEKEDNDDITISLAQLYAENPQAKSVGFFESRAAKVDYVAAFGFFESYTKFLLGLGNGERTKTASIHFYSWGLDAKQSEWRRFSATKALADIRNGLEAEGNTVEADKLDGMVKEIIAKETSPVLKQYYGMF